MCPISKITDGAKSLHPYILYCTLYNCHGTILIYFFVPLYLGFKTVWWNSILKKTTTKNNILSITQWREKAQVPTSAYWQIHDSLHEPNHFRDVASEVKLVLDAAGRLAPRLPSLQRQELGMIYWGDKTWLKKQQSNQSIGVHRICELSTY